MTTSRVTLSHRCRHGRRGHSMQHEGDTRNIETDIRIGQRHGSSCPCAAAWVRASDHPDRVASRSVMPAPSSDPPQKLGFKRDESGSPRAASRVRSKHRRRPRCRRHWRHIVAFARLLLTSPPPPAPGGRAPAPQISPMPSFRCPRAADGCDASLCARLCAGSP